MSDSTPELDPAPSLDTLAELPREAILEQDPGERSRNLLLLVVRLHSRTLMAILTPALVA